MNLLLFDFDGTLTHKDSALEFLKFTHSKWTTYLKLGLQIPVLVAWKLGFRTTEAAKKSIFKAFYNNWTEEQLAEKGRQFLPILKKLLLSEALSLLDFYQKNGDKVVIVSASLDVWLLPFCQELGVDCLCTRLAYQDGVFKGNWATPNCKKQEKVRRVMEMYDRTAFERVIAYGNSAGDAAMLAWADEGFYRFLQRKVK